MNSGKRYNIVKYLSVMLIVVGVALFMYKDGKSDGSGFTIGSGEMLLLTSLTLGGYKTNITDLLNRISQLFELRD